MKNIEEKVDYLYNKSVKRQELIGIIASLVGHVLVLFIGLLLSVMVVFAPDVPVLVIRILAAYSLVMSVLFVKQKIIEESEKE